MIYIGRILRPMSIVEIIIYVLLGAIVLGLIFKWFIYDIFIKPKKAKKMKNDKKNVYENEEEE